jgi:hypothetical protein
MLTGVARAALWLLILAMSAVVTARVLRQRVGTPPSQAGTLPKRIWPWMYDEPDDDTP